MIRTATVLALAGVLLGSPALAADVPPPVEPVAADAAPAQAFSWGGLYGGIHGGFLWPAGGSYPVAGLQLGYNFDLGRVVIGAEIEASGWRLPGFTESEGAFNVHAGFKLGARALVYAEAGVGVWAIAVPTANAGGGVEIALSNTISAFGEAKALLLRGGGLAYIGTQLRMGLNFHPGESPDARSAGAGADWGGVYFGVGGGFLVPAGAWRPEFALAAGYNFDLGRVVLGGEVEVGAWVPAWGVYLYGGSLNVRAGLEFGERALVYGEVGAGRWNQLLPVVTAGAGVEFAITDGLAAFAEAKAEMIRMPGLPYFGTQIRTGLVFHFGR